jgi:hypothetical protein
MSAQIMRADRPTADPGQASGIDVAMASAIAGYVAYFGSYVADAAAGTVTHRVIGAVHPAWVGMEITRRFILEGDLLTLQDDLTTADGVAVAAATSWQRMR